MSSSALRFGPDGMIANGTAIPRHTIQYVTFGVVDGLVGCEVICSRKTFRLSLMPEQGEAMQQWLLDRGVKWR